MVHDVIGEVDLAIVLQIVDELRRIENGGEQLVVDLLLVDEEGEQEPDDVRQQLEAIEVVDPFGRFDVLEYLGYRFPDPLVVQDMHDLTPFLHRDGLGLVNHLAKLVEHKLIVIAKILFCIQHLEVVTFILMCSRAMLDLDLMLVPELLFRSHLLLISSKSLVVRVALADHAHTARITWWRFLFHSEMHSLVVLLKLLLRRIRHITLVVLYEYLGVSLWLYNLGIV